MAQAETSTKSRISDIATRLGNEDEDVQPEEAAEMLDLLVMRASNLAAVKGGLDWEDVAEQLELSADVARKMAERNDEQ